MVSAITGNSQDQEELILFASDGKTSNFQGFDIDAMPPNFQAHRIRLRVRQTEIPFEQRTGPVPNLTVYNKVIDFFELFLHGTLILLDSS